MYLYHQTYQIKYNGSVSWRGEKFKEQKKKKVNTGRKYAKFDGKQSINSRSSTNSK